MAVTPPKFKTMPREEVRKVCLDYTIAGLETLSKLPRNNTAKPLQFLYVSGANTERDQTKKPWVLGDYFLLRVRIGDSLIKKISREKKEEKILTSFIIGRGRDSCS
jgi:hypothetical protein